MTRKSNFYSCYSYRASSRYTKYKTIFCVFCVVLVVFLICSIFGENVNLKKQPTAYLLALEKDSNYKMAQQKQLEAEEVVSACYIYKFDSLYYIVGFIYFDLSQAKSMLKKSQEVFPGAQILQQKQLKLKSKIKNSLKKDKQLLKIFNNILNLNQRILKLYEIGRNNKEEFKIYNNLVKLKLEFQQDYSLLSKKKNKIYQIVQSNMAIIISLIDNCYNSVVQGKNVQEKLKLLYIKIYFAQKELISSLNNM